MQLYNEKPSSKVSFHCSTGSESSWLGSYCTEIQGSSDLQSCPPRCTHKSGYNFGLQTQIGDHFRHIFLTTNTTNAVGTSRFHMWHQEFISSLAPQGCQSGTCSSVTLFPLGETGKGINGTKIQLHSQSRCISNFSKSNRLARQVCLRGEAPLTKSSR